MEKRRRIRLKLGRSLRPSLEENCLTCALWPICTDKSKSSGYLCSRFREADGERFDLDRMMAESAQDKEDTIQPWEPKTSDDDINFDVEKYVLDIVKNAGSMPDMSIDDGDFPQAKNFYEFTCSKMYQNMTPFGRQFEIAVNLMSEYCPYCTDMKWLDGSVSVKTKVPAYLEHVVLLENGICPQCDGRKSDMVAEGDLNDHYEMAGLAGQRGGKSAVTGMVTSYTNHLFLKLPNPSQFFGLLKNQQLGATFLATTQDQARKTIWDPIYQALTEGPWYKNYHKMLDYWHEKTGIEYYSLKDTYYWYRHRNLIGSVSGPNMRTLRGLTRYLGGIDEIGWFTGNDGAVKLNADEVHKAMRRSFLTLRAAHATLRKKGMNSIPAPMFLNISSPSSRYDKITKLYNQSKKSRMVYGFRYATWEMNPKVSRKVLAEEFAENYEKAMRDYGAKPPLSSAGFIGDINFVKKCLDPHRENLLKIKQVLVQTRANAVMTSGKAKIISPGTKTNHILTFDAGETHNCFAGETKVITRNGTKRIDRLIGKSVEVLTEGSKWVKTEFKCYGKAELYELELSFNGAKKVIRVTGNHRWFAFDKNRTRKELTTETLQTGYKIDSVLPPVNSDWSIDPRGVEHGVVMGDGHLGPWGKGQERHWSVANLCYHKIDFLLPYFERYRARGKYWQERGEYPKNEIVITHLPIEYKSVPSPRYDDSYLRGFIAGYIATDGCVDKDGKVMINSITKKNLRKLRDVCNKLGVATSPITCQETVNPFNGKMFKCYKLFFLRETFSAELLLNPQHRERFVNNTKDFNTRTKWTVESINKTKRREKVYCAEIPDTHSFVLEDYILTGNSFAFCVAHNDKALSPVIDAIGEVIPQKDHRINFRDVYDRILLPLIDEFNVIMAVTDRWQSKKILMDIETDRRVDTREYTVKYEDFEMLREDIHDATISFPRCEVKIPEILDLIDESYPKGFEGKPVAHLIAQIMTVRDFETSVEKGESTTDDIFRAVVLAHSFLRDKDLAPKFAGETAKRFGSFGFIGGAAGVQSVSGMGVMVSGSATGGGRSAVGIGASKTL